MIIQIILSVFQICFIPGYILYLFLNRNSKESNVLLIPVFSFGLSLIINYLIVVTLTYFHLYTKASLFWILIAEGTILAVVFIFNLINIKSYSISKNYDEIKGEIYLLAGHRNTRFGFIKFMIFSFSVLLLIVLCIQGVLNIGKIFSDWDVVFSWNRWALDFFNNKLPSSIYHYPQLLPANWSISYVLCGYPLQFIPKGIMPLFLIFPVYSILIMGITNRSGILLTSVIFIFSGMSHFHWRDGCADVPVAFYSILIFISLTMLKKDDPEANKIKYIVLSMMAVCGAAITKQAGIFLILIFPLLLYMFTATKFLWTPKRIFNICLLYLILLLVIVFPFYFYAEYAIKNGISASEIRMVTNEIYNGASYLERFEQGCMFFSKVFWTRIIFVLCLVPFALSFRDKTFRFLNLALVIPYFLIYAVFFSYDFRNSAIIVPYFCLAIGCGLDPILRRIFPHAEKLTAEKL